MPPVTAGAVQVSAITDAFVMAALFASELGASGLVVITAPLPDIDALELPTTFVASTVAWMLAPHARLYGEACRTEIGTVQVVVETLQCADSVVNVLPSL